MRSQALIPQYLTENGNSLIQNLAAIFGGVILLSILAQISIRLPFTPVPITGQTLGVALLALLWGSSRGASIMCLYVALGSAGLPIFALGRSGLVWGPTSGYLAGMLLASVLVGRLADLGWTKTFAKCLLATFVGSFCVFGCGLIILSYFVAKSELLVAGLFPFLAGDLIKNLLASGIAFRLRKRI